MSDSILQPLRRCSKCKRELPVTIEYFRKRNQGRYFRSECRDCERVRKLDSQKRNRPSATRRNQRYRENHADELAAQRAEPEAREKARKKARDWAEENPERAKQSHYDWYWSDPEAARQRSRDWRKANPEKSRESNKQARINHSETKKAANVRREARKRGLPDDFTPDDWLRMMNYFHGCCAVCGRQADDLFSTHTLANDHWIPLSSPECPGTIPTNIVPLCHGVGGCNNSKRNQLPLPWLTKRYGKRKARAILARIESYFASLQES